MKITKWLILLSLVFCRCHTTEEPDLGNPVLAIVCYPEVNDKYVYSVVPGMPEWKPESMAAAYEFCQLPIDVLKSISTQGLIDALVHAPLFDAMYMVSSLMSFTTWQNHYGHFNSALELFQREDAGEALVDYYKLIDFDCVTNLPFLSGISFSGREFYRISGIEMLFTKQEILDKMGHEKKKEIVAAILANLDKSDSNRITPMAFIMYADGYKPIIECVEKDPYILDGYLHSYDLIVSCAKNYINDKIEKGKSNR